MVFTRALALLLILLEENDKLISRKQNINHFILKTPFIFCWSRSMFDSSFFMSTTLGFRPYKGLCLVYFIDFFVEN